MNCQEVETSIIDLARNGALEAEERDSALAHLIQCRQCRDRVAEEKRLTEGLLAWNASLTGEQAPPDLEGTLRAAFRRKADPSPRRRWLQFAAAGSIAAAVLLFKLLSSATPPQLAPVAPRPQPPAAVTVANADRAVVSPARAAKRKRQATSLPHLPAAEVRTEFMPVAQGDEWTPLDGGRLVRVKLPRSAMSVFGIPVDPGRGPERVQADVVLSDDGLLRAIRFVR
jgi:hypothetical protein